MTSRKPGTGQGQLLLGLPKPPSESPDPAALKPAQLRKLTGSAPKARRHRQLWTDDEEAWLSSRYREGAQVWQIAQELGRSTWATQTRLYVLGEQRHTACQRCGRPLEQTGEPGHPRVYCEACFEASRYAARPEPDSRTCPVCQQTFTPDANDERNLYCSKKCNTAAWYARVREQREAARARYGASEFEVNAAQLAEIIRLRQLGASWRTVETQVGVHRKLALRVLADQAHAATNPNGL